jgi:hypothetical protein
LVVALVLSLWTSVMAEAVAVLVVLAVEPGTTTAGVVVQARQRHLQAQV